MSYDLAVWEGARPVDDAAALTVFEDFYDRFMRNRGLPPTPGITRYVEALVARWPDLSPEDEDEDGSPWADGPLIDNASGPLLYFGMVFSKYQEAAPFAVDLARTLGLTCFDPQDQRMLGCLLREEWFRGQHGSTSSGTHGTRLLCPGDSPRMTRLGRPPII